MRQSKAKRLKRQADLSVTGPKAIRLAYKALKKSVLGLNHGSAVSFSKKRHTGESLEDFQARRRICNKKRRQREDGHRLLEAI